MSREIKFRAFYKPRNEMIYDGDEWLPEKYDDRQPRYQSKPVYVTNRGIHYDLVSNDQSFVQTHDKDGKYTGDYYANWDMELLWDKGNQDIELMQFTGLHDKNGKEIYEGDIVRFKLDEKDENVEIGKVFWNDFRASFAIEMNPYANNDLFKYVRNGTVEVIGNIYDNPSLLEVQP